MGRGSKMRESDIKKTADALAAEYQTHEPFSLCRAMGIDVLFVPLTDTVRAFTFTVPEKGIDQIFLDDSLGEEEQTVLLSHELGHRVLHGGLNSFFLRRRTNFPLGGYEREADCFARCLLSETTLDLTNVDPAVREILLK